MTRPVLMLDESNRQMYLFYTIDYLTRGKISYKTSPVGATLRFASGQGTRAIGYSGADINDASGSKDPVNSTTGLVVLASDERNNTYYHAEMDLPAPADTVAPSKPTVTVTPGPGSAEVRWTEATDNVAVAGYRVVRDNAVIWETTSGTSYTDAPVSTGSHSYAVTAFDGAGNTSTSATVTVTVPAPSGPAAPTGLTATATSPTSVGLTWNAPANTAGVVGYRVYRGSTLLASPTATVYTDTGAAAATTYTYAVASVDSGGQESARITATVTTPAAPGSDIGVRAVSTTQSAGTTSLAIPTPAGVQAGDVMFAALETVSTPKVRPPSGWKLVQARRSSTTLKVFVYWRAAGSAEPASQVWKLSSPKPVAASVVAYTGVSAASPVEASGSRYGSSTTKIATAPITTKTARARVVAVYGIGTATTVTPPAALTERADLSATNGSTAVTLALADYRQDTPGAGASLTAVAGAAARYASVVLALTPTG